MRVSFRRLEGISRYINKTHTHTHLEHTVFSLMLIHLQLMLLHLKLMLIHLQLGVCVGVSESKF